MAWIGLDGTAATHVDPIAQNSTTWFGLAMAPPEPFTAIRVQLATYGTSTSDVRLELRAGNQSTGTLIKSEVFNDIADNGWVTMELGQEYSAVCQLRVYTVSGSIAIYSYNTNPLNWSNAQRSNSGTFIDSPTNNRAFQIRTVGGITTKRWDGTTWVDAEIKRIYGGTWIDPQKIKY